MLAEPGGGTDHSGTEAAANRCSSCASLRSVFARRLGPPGRGLGRLGDMRGDPHPRQLLGLTLLTAAAPGVQPRDSVMALTHKILVIAWHAAYGWYWAPELRN